MKQSEKATIGRITCLKETSQQKEELVDGYCIPLDGEEFRIMVTKKTYGRQPGYQIKVTYHWGDDIGISLDNAQLYPQATEIFNSHHHGEWVNEDPSHPASKCITFGPEEKDKHSALELMHKIIKETL